MRHRPSLPSRAAGVLLAALLALAAGCGPGTGGTGDGEVGGLLAPFQAVAASVCTDALGLALGCAAVAGPDAEPAAIGDLVFGSAGGSPVSLILQGNRAELSAPCQGVRFVGAWGVDGAGAARYFGTTLSVTGQAGAPASLAVQGPDAAGALVVVLRDLAGRPLLGPLALQRSAAVPPALAACR